LRGSRSAMARALARVIESSWSGEAYARRSQVRHRPEPIQANQVKLSKDGLDLLDLIFPISIFQWVRAISRYARNVSSAPPLFLPTSTLAKLQSGEWKDI
jgi:hypothetical protein